MVDERDPGNGQLGQVSAQGLAGDALLQFPVLVGAGRVSGSSAGHPVAQGDDGHVVAGLRVHGCRLACQQGAYVLAEEILEAACLPDAVIPQDAREPLGESGKVGGDCLGGEADTHKLREAVDEGEPVGERVTARESPEARYQGAWALACTPGRASARP